MADWSYDPTARRYRDRETGRFLSATGMAEIRDDLQARLREDVRALADRLADGKITVQSWERQLQRQVKQVHALEWAFGRGGRKQMTENDWAEVGQSVREQFTHLRAFARQVEAGKLTPKQIAARSELYLHASTTSYERGRGAAFGLRLPSYPGQGTRCQAQCRCRWDIQATDTEWRAYWRLGSAEHCSTCQNRAALWAPLIIPRGLRVVA